MQSKNIGFILIILGGIVEVFWVSGLKYADSLWLYILTGIGIMFSFTAMITACRSVEVSVAYAVFVGIGTAGVVMAEMLYFGERFDIWRVGLICVLLVGVIGLKLISKEGDKEMIEEFSHELGLDELTQNNKNT